MNERTKELYIDVLVKIMQVVFAALVIGPFVAGKFDIMTMTTGLIATLLCVAVASAIALSLKGKGA